MIDRATSDVALKSIGAGHPVEHVAEVLGKHAGRRSDAVQCLLEGDLAFTTPNGCAPNLPALTYKQVFSSEPKKLPLVVVEIHLENVVDIDSPPLYILVPQVRTWVSPSFAFDDSIFPRLVSAISPSSTSTQRLGSPVTRSGLPS